MNQEAFFKVLAEQATIGRLVLAAFGDKQPDVAALVEEMKQVVYELLNGPQLSWQCVRHAAFSAVTLETAGPELKVAVVRWQKDGKEGFNGMVAVFRDPNSVHFISLPSPMAGQIFRKAAAFVPGGVQQAFST